MESKQSFVVVGDIDVADGEGLKRESERKEAK